jgi:hypothetical protein
LHLIIFLGDQSAATSEIDQRICQIIDMEDADVIADLRSLNGSKHSLYDVFWEACEKFLEEDIFLATDDRRHGDICHLSRAISIRDLVDQVSARCLAGTQIPCLEWVRLQFRPKTSSAIQQVHHTGRFKMKYMVQQRQFRHSHIDAHYAAASFRHMRDYSLLVKQYCTFICLDDKHKISVGEPHYPVAAADRGWRVLVKEGERFMVGDNDFTKFSLVPSVVFIISIPIEITGSWYNGMLTT